MRIETEKTWTQTQRDVISAQQDRSHLVQALNDIEYDLAQAHSQFGESAEVTRSLQDQLS